MRFSALTALLVGTSLVAAPVFAQVRPASSVPERVVVERSGAPMTDESALSEPLGAIHYLGGLAILAGLGYLIYSLLLKKDEPASP